MVFEVTSGFLSTMDLTLLSSSCLVHRGRPDRDLSSTVPSRWYLVTHRSSAVGVIK